MVLTNMIRKKLDESGMSEETVAHDLTPTVEHSRRPHHRTIDVGAMQWTDYVTVDDGHEMPGVLTLFMHDGKARVLEIGDGEFYRLIRDDRVIDTSNETPMEE